MTAVITAVVVFALPLGVAARLLLVSQEMGELQTAALVTAARTDTARLATGDQVEAPAADNITVEILDAHRRASARGALISRDALLERALHGRPAQGREGDRFVAVVPLVAGEVVVGAVRASSPTAALGEQVLLIWAGMALAALVAALLAWAVSRRQVRILVGPVERLAMAARALGGGVFTPVGQRSGLAEVDSVADALDETAGRLDALLTRERAFSAHASHQLRTPLAGLELVLEEALVSRAGDPWAVMAEALTVSRRMEGTIEDVLRFTRPDGRPRAAERPLTMRQLATDIGHRWHGDLARSGRTLTVPVEPPDEAVATSASTASVRQIIDVLIANALHHGQGPVEVRLRRVATHLAVDVEDRGTVGTDPLAASTDPSRDGPSGTGLGLPLARQMAAAENGRLTLTSMAPTTFTLLLPG